MIYSLYQTNETPFLNTYMYFDLISVFSVERKDLLDKVEHVFHNIFSKISSKISLGSVFFSYAFRSVINVYHIC